MLDKSILSQLKQLKRDIEDSKEYAEGIVKGTQRKFGFVMLEDGREIYLNPDQMQKVLPGDTVKILIVSDKDKKTGKLKTSAVLQKLINSSLKEFTGRYVIKGQGHFVEPDLPQLSRWIFIPPHARNGAKNGDYIQCKISRHPYPSAKPQAKILQLIGDADKIGIEADYIISKFQLNTPWPEDWQQQLSTIDETARQDLTATPFITIDAPSTQDMDDALFASENDQGWQLQVAIADPCAFITSGSALDKSAAQRGNSNYLPGRSLAMLPPELANQQCSLLAGEKRPGLLCSININQDGSIRDYHISEAMVRSAAKLSYQEVAAYLDATTQDDENISASCREHHTTLAALQSLSAALHDHRKKHNLIIPNRQDYRLLLDSKKKLEKIEAIDKNSAQQLVEESMVATNRCAADMLGEKGLFISHPGFRKERLPDVRKLAEEQLAITDIDFSSPDGYRHLMNNINDEALDFPLRAVLSRLLERSRLSNKPQPHYGMGLDRYTTFTSPIRKYSDLLVHRIIKAKIQQQNIEPIPEQQQKNLQQAQDNSRQAKLQMEQWLKCQLMKPLVGQAFTGEVVQINSNGFTVKLDDTLVDGFIETRLLEEKYSFDPMRLRLKSKSRTVELQQKIDVIVSEVDCNSRNIRYTLAKTDITTEASESSPD